MLYLCPRLILVTTLSSLSLTVTGCVNGERITENSLLTHGAVVQITVAMYFSSGQLMVQVLLLQNHCFISITVVVVEKMPSSLNLIPLVYSNGERIMEGKD